MTVAMERDKADYLARVFVNGLRKFHVPFPHAMNGHNIPNSGNWSHTFRDLPIVKRADREGWAKELRSVVIATVRGRLMMGKDYANIAGLMPPDDWIAAQSARAERNRLAAKWRAQMAEQYGSYDKFLAHGKRHMASDRRFGAAKSLAALLTPTSKRMTGERDE